MDTRLCDVPKGRLSIGRIPRRITGEMTVRTLNLPEVEVPNEVVEPQKTRRAKKKKTVVEPAKSPAAARIRRPKRMWD